MGVPRNLLSAIGGTRTKHDSTVVFEMRPRTCTVEFALKVEVIMTASRSDGFYACS